MGDDVPLWLDLGGAKLLWWLCGDIGDFGATARTLSGESGDRHWSFAKNRKKWFIISKFS